MSNIEWTPTFGPPSGGPDREMTNLLMPDWMEWDGRFLVIEGRRVPAKLSSVEPPLKHPTPNDCTEDSPTFHIYMENGALLIVDVGWLDLALPPRLHIAVHLYVLLPGTVTDFDDEPIDMPNTPASIEDGKIVPTEWDPRRDSWFCDDIASGTELLRYVDAWGKLPVLGLNSTTFDTEARLG